MTHQAAKPLFSCLLPHATDGQLLALPRLQTHSVHQVKHANSVHAGGLKLGTLLGPIRRVSGNLFTARLESTPKGVAKMSLLRLHFPTKTPRSKRRSTFPTLPCALRPPAAKLWRNSATSLRRQGFPSRCYHKQSSYTVRPLPRANRSTSPNTHLCIEPTMATMSPKATNASGSASTFARRVLVCRWRMSWAFPAAPRDCGLHLRVDRERA